MAKKERLLRPVRRRHRRHQRLGLRRDRDRAQAQGPHRQGLRRPQRHHRRADRGPDRHRQGIGRGDRGAALHAVGRLRLLPLQAQVARSQPARIRAPDRGLQGARHRLLLLQRRRRLGRHLLQGEPAVARRWATRCRRSTCRRPSTTTCRSPTAARASARSPSTSPSRRSKPRSTCARWPRPRPRCSCSR